MNKILVTGIGEGAKEIIDLLYKKDKNFFFLCITQGRQFLNLPHRKNVWYNDFEYQKTKGDFEYYKKIMLNKTAVLNKELSLFNKAVVVVCLNETFVSEVLLNTLEYMAKCGINTDIFALNIFEYGIEVLNIDNLLTKLYEKNYSSGYNLFLHKFGGISPGNKKLKERIIAKSADFLRILLEFKSKDGKNEND